MLSHASSSQIADQLTTIDADNLIRLPGVKDIMELEIKEFTAIWLPTGTRCSIEIEDLNFTTTYTRDLLLFFKSGIISKTDLIGSSSKWASIQVSQPMQLNEQRSMMLVCKMMKLNYECMFVFKDYLQQVSVTSINPKILSILKPIGSTNDISQSAVELIPLKSGMHSRVPKAESQSSTFDFELLEAIPGMKSSSMLLNIVSKSAEINHLSESIEKASILLHYVSSFNGDSDSHDNTRELRTRLEYLSIFASNNQDPDLTTNFPRVDMEFQKLLLHLKEVGYERVKQSKDDDYDEQLPSQLNLDFLDLFWDLISNLEQSEAFYALSLMLSKLVAGDFVPLVFITNRSTRIIIAY